MSAPKNRRSIRVGLSRRTFLKNIGLGGITVGTLGSAGCGSSPQVAMRIPAPGAKVFAHGVASGDPLSDRVILWTRVTPASTGTVVGRYAVALDTAMTQIVREGSFSTSAARDYTVKVDPQGLQPATTYYYQFSALGEDSEVARTRTLPVGSIDHLRFAVLSCASFPHGFFNAYRRVAERPDLDCVFHLGDYVYEYGNGPGEYGADIQAGGRKYVPENEMISLEDYRTRHAHYKLDADLQACHKQHAFITTWDDHESTNDSWQGGAENHTEGAEGVWAQRKNWAQQAYNEWMPIRGSDINVIYRRFTFGDLVDLVVLDTRLFGREEPLEPNGAPIANTGFSTFFLTGEFADPDRQLLGEVQENWMYDQLTSSTAKWKLLGQQIMFGQLKFQGAPNALGTSQYINQDQWDGYDGARQRIYNFLQTNSIDNMVVLTGDIHTAWSMDLSPDPNNPAAYNSATGVGSRAVEFVATSVTSPGLDQLAGAGEPGLMSQNPHMKYINLADHGYLILDITPERCQGEHWLVGDILAANETESSTGIFQTADGENRLIAGTESSPKANPPELAP